MVPASAGGKWGLIDAKGNYVAEPAYDEIREAREGRIPFRLGAAWGFLDATGRVSIAPKYLTVDSFRSGWARVTQFSGKSGFVDREGSFVEHRLMGDLQAIAEP